MSWPEEMNSLVATKNFRERSNTGNQQVLFNDLIPAIDASQQVIFFVLFFPLNLLFSISILKVIRLLLWRDLNLLLQIFNLYRFHI